MANTNRLINEPSPYLQQHAHNPVHWYPWGDEAFNKAAEENKPIIISIGYSSCHWCHVMEEESFENEEVARLMNEHFISIKVDREERPDIDAHYMNALQMITGRGGWPMNMFALPDGSPFYGGTYFPRDQWMNLLTLVAGQYKSNTEEMVRAAESIEQGISNFKIKLLETEESPYSIDQLGSSVAQTSPQFDLINGGISGAPKFPMPVFTRFLLSWSVLQNDPETRDFVLLTLDKMAAGGIYDQIGGGFSRYSTDVKWKVPHFEKMLYDNAQLLSLYAKAYSLTKKEQYKNVVYQTMDYIEESMTSPRGIFYSALDADSEGEEGLFYTWEKRELLELLAEDYPLAKEYYGIGVAGAWEGGKNILLRPDLQDSQNPAGKDLERIRSILKEARDKRVPPRLDDKSLTSWNALMISAYIDAFNAFGDPRFLHKAEQATDFILENQLQPDGSLYHAFKENRSYIDGFLEDYAHLISALISLFEAGGKVQYLSKAEELTAWTLKYFYNEDENIFYSTAVQDRIIQKDMEVSDVTLPSSNAVMAHNMFRLAKLTGTFSFQNKADQMTRWMARRVLENTLYFSHWAELMLYQKGSYYEVVVVGEKAEALIGELRREYLPQAVFAFSKVPDESRPLFAGRYKPDETLIYICRDNSCGLPVRTVEEALEQIRGEEQGEKTFK